MTGGFIAPKSTHLFDPEFELLQLGGDCPKTELPKVTHTIYSILMKIKQQDMGLEEKIKEVFGRPGGVYELLPKFICPNRSEIKQKKSHLLIFSV